MPVTHAPISGNDKVQATLRLPRPLYEQAKRMVEEGRAGASSVNDMLVAALGAYLDLLRRKEIDELFSAMAADDRFQEEAQRIAKAFEESDWGSLDSAERESAGSDAAW